MTLFDLDLHPIPAWHHGFRYAVKKGYRWANRWLTHPSSDLARPFEVGTRAFHARNDGSPAGPVTEVGASEPPGLAGDAPGPAGDHSEGSEGG